MAGGIMALREDARPRKAIAAVATTSSGVTSVAVLAATVDAGLMSVQQAVAAQLWAGHRTVSTAVHPRLRRILDPILAQGYDRADGIDALPYLTVELRETAGAFGTRAAGAATVDVGLRTIQ
jgi:hypothetical protein